MKQYVTSIKAGYKIFVVLLFICNMGLAQKTTDSVFTGMMGLCKNFADSYLPTYVTPAGDSLIVSMISTPTADINTFLFDCIKAKNFKPLKFSAVVLIKQHNEYINVNHQDYNLDDSTYAKNGFVEMLRVAMGLGRSKDGIGNIEQLNTGDVYDWIKKNPKKFDDYAYVKQFISDTVVIDLNMQH